MQSLLEACRLENREGCVSYFDAYDYMNFISSNLNDSSMNYSITSRKIGRVDHNKDDFLAAKAAAVELLQNLELF